jgi:cyanophycin synthetase
VVGDGTSTIGELIARENQRRIDGNGELGLSLLRLDLDGAFALRQAGLSLRAVPTRGQRIRVKAATSESGVRENETYRSPLSPDLVAAAKEAAGLVGALVTGVDVIAPDPAAPPAATGSVIMEVNGTPGLHHHYHVAEPRSATPVAATILERLLSA